MAVFTYKAYDSVEFSTWEKSFRAAGIHRVATAAWIREVMRQEVQSNSRAYPFRGASRGPGACLEAPHTLSV
eukprot:9482769-Pyramimonas_sp.AAC.1